MPSGPRINQLDADLIRKLHAQGYTWAAIERETGRSETTIYRVLKGLVFPPRADSGVSASPNLSIPFPLERAPELQRTQRIDSPGWQEKSTMTHASRDDIRQHFIEQLTGLGFTIRAPQPRLFVTELVKALFAEKFEVAVLKRAAERISHNRTSLTFPMIAHCKIECRNAKAEVEAARVEAADAGAEPQSLEPAE